MGWHGAGTAEWSYLASPSEIKRLVFQEWRRERPMTTLLSSPREFCALWDQESQSLLLAISLLCCCLRPQGRTLSLSAAIKRLQLPGQAFSCP